MFPKNSGDEHENDCNTNTHMNPIEGVYFNDRWKYVYNWIREVNDQNRIYYTKC